MSRIAPIQPGTPFGPRFAGRGRAGLHNRLMRSHAHYGRKQPSGWMRLMLLLALVAGGTQMGIPKPLRFWEGMGQPAQVLPAGQPTVAWSLPTTPVPSATSTVPPVPVIPQERLVDLYPGVTIPVGTFPVIGYRSYAATHDMPASWFGDGLHRGQDLFGKTAVSMFNDNEVIYIGPHQLDNADHTIGKGAVVITRRPLPDGRYLYSLYAHFMPPGYYRRNPGDPRIQQAERDGIDPVIRVKPGDVLRAGDVIADIHTMGYTSPLYLPHLHLETFIGGEWTPGCDSPYPHDAVLVDTTAVLALADNAPEDFRAVGDSHRENPVTPRPAGQYAENTCAFLEDYQ